MRIEIMFFEKFRLQNKDLFTAWKCIIEYFVSSAEKRILTQERVVIGAEATQRDRGLLARQNMFCTPYERYFSFALCRKLAKLVSFCVWKIYFPRT